MLQTALCVPEYYFDLELPPRLRYQQLFPQYTELVQEYVQEWVKSSGFTMLDLQLFDYLHANNQDYELMEETEYFASITSIPFNQMLFLQYMYDFGYVGCTSILVAPNNSTPYLSRNLDWGFQRLISNLTIIAHYFRNSPEQIVFSQVAIVGQLSVGHTVQSKNSSLSLNALQPQFNNQELLKYLYNHPSAVSAIRVVRKLLEQFHSFEDIKNYLNHLQVIRHAYINIVGQNANEIAIFRIPDWTMPFETTQITKLNSNQSFLVATNGDYDPFSVKRKEVAQERLETLSEVELSDPNIVRQKVQQQYPNRNPETILTATLTTDGINVHSYY